MEHGKHQLIVTEYSEYPGPRYCSQGDSSGEHFYHTQLNIAFVNALKDKKKLTVILDATAGYASSFLDEAFGNLIYDFTLSKVKDNLTIISEEEPDWIEMITTETYKEWEERRKNNQTPRKTINHVEWFKLQKNELISDIWIQL